MLHWCSSECAAGTALLVWAGVVAAIAYGPPNSNPLVPQTWWQYALWFVAGLALCRYVARGTMFAWPVDVSYKGQVALVVGAASGVGYGTALELATHGWTVLLAGRDVRRLLQAKQRIQCCLGRQPPARRGAVKVVGTVDLCVEASVRRFAQELATMSATHPISLLVNAAGVMMRHLQFCPHIEAHWAGVETMLVTNALGPLLLTQLLLPMLDEAARRSGRTSRVVNVASSCHTYLGPGCWPFSARYDPVQMIRGLDAASLLRRTSHLTVDGATPAPGVAIGDVGGDLGQVVKQPAVARRYVPRDFGWTTFVGYYGLSKLCVVWNTALVAQQVRSWVFDPACTAPTQRVLVTCCHPGIITTHLYRDLLPIWVLDYVIYWPSLILGRTWREAAQSTLRAALCTSDARHGGYYLCSGEFGSQSRRCCLSHDARDKAACAFYARWAAGKIGLSEGLFAKQHAG